jgi:hypothetical protein
MTVVPDQAAYAPPIMRSYLSAFQLSDSELKPANNILWKRDVVLIQRTTKRRLASRESASFKELKR